MEMRKPPVTSWQLMQDMKRAVGMTGMQKIFSCGHTQINRYCRNPEYTADSERNPVDRMRMLLEEAWDCGAESAVKDALRHIMAPLGMTPAPLAATTPDGDDMRHEILQGLFAVTEFAKMAGDGEHYTVLSDALEKAIKELTDIWVRARTRDTGNSGR